jgi:putative GTP pyrophosphokinase
MKDTKESLGRLKDCKTANKQDVIKIQDEFFRIYQIGDREELEKFSKDLDLISQRYRAQSLR